MTIKTHGGTQKNEGNLCDSCKYCLHVKGHNLNQELVFCNWSTTDKPMLLPFPVAECNKYKKEGMMWLGDMEKIALIVKIPDRQAGFKTSDDK